MDIYVVTNSDEKVGPFLTWADAFNWAMKHPEFGGHIESDELANWQYMKSGGRLLPVPK